MIIGRNPHERIRHAASRSRNVVITGEVDNIWSYYKAIDVFVGPLLTGGGLQNKVIEAMFANKLVICTSIANGGVEAINGESIVIADTADAFVDALDEAFADPGRRTRIASRGAEYARIKFDWESIAADLYEFISAAERC